MSHTSYPDIDGARIFNRRELALYRISRRVRRFVYKTDDWGMPRVGDIAWTIFFRIRRIVARGIGVQHV